MIKKKEIIDFIIKEVGSKNLIYNDLDLDKYNKDWRGFYNFKSICAVFPENKEQIKIIINFCNKHNIKIVPQAGNTSLTGASVPTKDYYEIIINCSKLNKIIHLDKFNNLIEVESGVTLDAVKIYCEVNNLYFPVSLSSSGSCLIGGNIATNAGGINALKYGSMSENLKGIEVILGDGSEMNFMSPMKKNNTGYNLKSLFCGSEGTLGIITKALLKVYPKPKSYFHTLFSFNSIEETINFFEDLRGNFNDSIESAEIIPKIALDQTIKHGFLKKSFFVNNYESFLLCKFSLFDDKKKFEEVFINDIQSFKNKFEDLIIPQSIQQEKNLWKFRDNLVESYKIEGKFITNDISLPLNKMNDFINEASIKINDIVPNTRIYSFGHLGDGNIHFNMIEPENFKENFDNYRKKIYKIVNDLVFKFGGSFSAEHGIGMIKKESLIKYKDKQEVEFMKKIKITCDPNNILNPGKIFDL